MKELKKVGETRGWSIWYMDDVDRFVLAASGTTDQPLVHFDARVHWQLLPLIGEFYWDEGLPDPEDRKESTSDYERWVFGTIVSAEGGNAMVTWEVQRFFEEVVEYIVTEPFGPVSQPIYTGKMEWRTFVRVLEVE